MGRGGYEMEWNEFTQYHTNCDDDDTLHRWQ